MELFSSDKDLLKSIADELTTCGCCPRCVLRYLGAKDMYTYRGNTKEMLEVVKQLQTPHDKSSCKTPEETENEIANTDFSDESMDTSLIEPDDISATHTENDSKPNDSKPTSNEEQNESANGQCSQDKPVSSNGDTQETSGTSSCSTCLGILDKFTEDDFLTRIKKETVDDGFHFSSYLCSLMLPVCIILREHALLLHLKEKFKDVYGSKNGADVAQIKDIWKWRNGPLLKEILNSPFDVKGAFDITLTFEYQNSGKECSFLLNSSSSDTFRKRKQDRRHNRKAAHALYTRANVGKAIEDMKDDEFRRSYRCPPLLPSCVTSCDIKCQNENVFIAGRYNKYSRELSQTPWIIEGTRKSESSVEELLSGEINKQFRPTEQKFSSSGREDVDVRMLGNGRPFVLELVNPRRRDFPQEEMSKMEMDINSSTSDIKCSDLQIVSKDETDILKQGEIDKVKWYRALCWSQHPLAQEQMDQLSAMKDLKILQKTPIRVLHRRPLATRDRLIHTMNASRVDDTHFTVDLSTQAGTYIKEFIHGDFGRTKPNFFTILGVECDILELDVTAIELDWPKKIITDQAPTMNSCL